MQVPNRLPIGQGRKTVAFYTEEFCGHPDDFKLFNSTQRRHYDELKSILGQAGLELSLMGAEFTEGGLLRFVVCAGDPKKPSFIWQKYEGNTPGGGQARVYVAGKTLHLSSFLAMDRFMAVMHCIQTEAEKNA